MKICKLRWTATTAGMLQIDAYTGSQLSTAADTTAAKESREAISVLYNRIYIIPWRFLLLHYLYQNLGGQRNVYKQNIIWSSHGYNHSYAAADVIWTADFTQKVNSVNRSSIFQYFCGSYYIDDGIAS